jgi:hypothetical protein
MGAFAVRHLREGRLIGAITAPNLLHDEGADYCLRRMFPVGGSFAPARSDWMLCIGGINCNSPGATPSGSSLTQIPYNRETGFYAIVALYQNEGGALGQTHANILGYARQPVSFALDTQGRSVLIATAEKEYTNQIPWADLGTWPDPEVKPQHQPFWEPNHQYPWRKPIWKYGYWGTSGEAGAWSDMLTGNPVTGATFSVGVAFIVSASGTPILLASAVFSDCLVIRPGDELWLRYASRVRPGRTSAGGWTTAEFTSLLAERAWGNVPAAEPSEYAAVLLADAPGSLDWTATLDASRQIVEVGFSEITSWSKGLADYEVIAQCPGWQNTSGQTWPVANYVGVMAIFDGVKRLCWFDPIEPVAVADGDTVTFPDGIGFSLRDNYA